MWFDALECVMLLYFPFTLLVSLGKTSVPLSLPLIFCQNIHQWNLFERCTKLSISDIAGRTIMFLMYCFYFYFYSSLHSWWRLRYPNCRVWMPAFTLPLPFGCRKSDPRSLHYSRWNFISKIESRNLAVPCNSQLFGHEHLAPSLGASLPNAQRLEFQLSNKHRNIPRKYIRW